MYNYYWIIIIIKYEIINFFMVFIEYYISNIYYEIMKYESYNNITYLFINWFQITSYFYNNLLVVELIRKVTI